MTKMKLLFTCPHGGQNDDGTTTNPPIIKRENTPPHFSPDKCPAAEGEGFKNINDSLTLKLTEAIVKNITKLSGKDPYAVYAEYNRRWIDYNRKEICAYDQSGPNPKAQEKYQKYHNEILQIIEEMLPQDDNSMAFLFDIHGTDREHSPEAPYDFIELLVGTDQTYSRKALTDADFWDEYNGLIPLLRTKNIRAYPEDLTQERKKFPLDGGYTIKKYGSNGTKPGLVAIQIKVINCIRDNRYCREKFAADMTYCILKFVSPFIPT